MTLTGEHCIKLQECNALEKVIIHQLKFAIMAIGDTGTFTDPRDGQVYPWKVMKDGKKWMTKNLNFKSSHSMCYDNKAANGTEYGRLYPQKDIPQLSPSGWHVPTIQEWENMYEGEGCDGSTAAALLPSGSSGFDAKHAGLYAEDGRFVGLGENASFWSSTEGGEAQGIKTNFHVYITNIVGYGVATGDDTSANSIRLIAD